MKGFAPLPIFVDIQTTNFPTCWKQGLALIDIFFFIGDPLKISHDPKEGSTVVVPRKERSNINLSL